ncbi:hypothetical protein D3C71_754590 [compost metagenome]
MQPHAITHASFNGVPKGMAKIEDGTKARLFFILADNPGLDLATAPYSVRQGVAVVRDQGIHIAFQPIKEGHVRDWSVFDDLCKTGTELTRWQRIEHRKVAHHQLRLVERANHVLAEWMVDRRLASHRRIHLGQQRRGHLHKRHTPHVAGCGKTRHVTNDPAAQRKDGCLAIATIAQQRIKN